MENACGGSRGTRGSRSGVPCRRGGGMPRRGSGFRRKLPFRGSVQGEGRAGGERGLGGVPPRGGSRGARALGVLAGSQPYFSSGESSGQGKAGALWETAFPLLRPLPSPRTTPSLALVFAWTSLWPGQFLRKTDACHKPLGNRHHAHPSKNACSPNGLQGVMFSGEVLRQHGASGKAGSWRRAAVARQADRLSEDLLPLGRCAGYSKGERKARGRRNSKAENAWPEAP